MKYSENTKKIALLIYDKKDDFIKYGDTLDLITKNLPLSIIIKNILFYYNNWMKKYEGANSVNSEIDRNLFFQNLTRTIVYVLSNRNDILSSNFYSSQSALYLNVCDRNPFTKKSLFADIDNLCEIVTTISRGALPNDEKGQKSMLLCKKIFREAIINVINNLTDKNSVKFIVVDYQIEVIKLIETNPQNYII